MIKTSVDGKKCIVLAGKPIPYRTERHGRNCSFVIGRLRIPYWRSEADNRLCIPVFGRELKLWRNKRQRHYAMRGKLTDEKVRALLLKELPPLLGYAPDLDHPKTLNEKINWLKLYYHNPLITRCCDKYAVKGYAAECIGAEHVLPVLAVWERVEDVDFDVLPERFVIKVNWSSGYNIIVKDKAGMDRREVLRKLRGWMRPEQNSYYDMFNWGYKDMKPVIYAEPYIEQMDGQLYDYKFHMCGGKFRFMLIATDRFKGHLAFNYYDENFNWLDIRCGVDYSKFRPEKPSRFDEMIALAEKLSAPFPYVRVDFYEVDGHVYLGEMTFYPSGGRVLFDPPKWDRILGEKIPLPAEPII